MNPYNAIDLSKVPVPDAVKLSDPAAIRSWIIERAVQGMREFYPNFDYPLVSDPGYQYAGAAAYRHVHHEQRVNEAVRAVMLASSSGTDLDNLAAFFKVERLVIVEGDDSLIPPQEEVKESDEALRQRCALSPEGYTTAGSYGSYIFHALSADGNVKSVAAISPAPTEMDVYVLSHDESGVPDTSLLEVVHDYLSDKRPDGDLLQVKPAEIVPYSIDATLNFFSGASPALIVELAETAIKQWVKDNEQFGRDVVRSAIDRQLHQEGVYRVEIHQPSVFPLVIQPHQVAKCSGITLRVGRVGE